MGSRKDLGVGVARKGGVFADGGGKRKQQSQLSHPGLSPHYKQTHSSTLENNNPFIRPVWNLIIDFRPWMESWEGVGSWKMGWGGE